jgi:hypothetical protein
MYIWLIFLQHLSAEIGHCQITRNTKVTKKDYCTVSSLNLHKIILQNKGTIVKGVV